MYKLEGRSGGWNGRSVRTAGERLVGWDGESFKGRTDKRGGNERLGRTSEPHKRGEAETEYPTYEQGGDRGLGRMESKTSWVMKTGPGRHSTWKGEL